VIYSLETKSSIICVFEHMAVSILFCVPEQGTTTLFCQLKNKNTPLHLSTKTTVELGKMALNVDYEARDRGCRY
jgi:hypothetical protein